MKTAALKDAEKRWMKYRITECTSSNKQYSMFLMFILRGYRWLIYTFHSFLCVLQATKNFCETKQTKRHCCFNDESVKVVCAGFCFVFKRRTERNDFLLSLIIKAKCLSMQVWAVLQPWCLHHSEEDIIHGVLFKRHVFSYKKLL